MHTLATAPRAHAADAVSISEAAAAVVEQDLDYICEAAADELDRLRGRHVLITGGAGFLGFYLVQALLHANRHAAPSDAIRVTVLDNYVRGVPDWMATRRDDPHLSTLRHDISRPLPQDLGGFEYIVHAASIASPTFYRRKPIETMDANVNGLRYLLEHARETRAAGGAVEGFLFFSTSEIYGDPDPANIPTPETYRGNVSCTGPRACYDEAKRYGETLCVNFAAAYDLPIKIVRPFNNYGPGLKITDRRVLPDLARDVLSDRDIVLLSDGAPTRTFCYVADAVVGYLKVLVRGRQGEPYNIGVETPEISMRNFAERVASAARDLFGYEGRVIHAPSSDGDYLVDNPTRRCPIIAKAREELGYRPGIALDEGLRRSLLWYRAHREAEES